MSRRGERLDRGLSGLSLDAKTRHAARTEAATVDMLMVLQAIDAKLDFLCRLLDAQAQRRHT